MDRDYDLEDLKYAARYPFTKLAKEIITGKEVKIDYEVMERASRRASNGVIYENIPILETSDKELLARELLSYPIARMIISLIGIKYLNRYVNSEVKRATRYLQENEEDKERIAKEFGISLSKNKIDVKSYLRYIPKTKEYSIVNQDLNEGSINLDSGGVIAILSEAVRQHIQMGMPIKREGMPKDLTADLEESANKLQEEIREARIVTERVGRVETGGEIAPCIKRLLDQLKNGENVPHIGRWVVAAYLLKKGFSVDEIVTMFSSAPNFDEKVTRYQVEFIKKKNYGIPSCVNLDSYGVCIQKCGIKHPLFYGTKRTFREPRESGDKGKGYPRKFSGRK